MELSVLTMELNSSISFTIQDCQFIDIVITNMQSLHLHANNETCNRSDLGKNRTAVPFTSALHIY